MNMLSRTLPFHTLRARFLAVNVPLVLIALAILFALFELNASHESYAKLQDKLDNMIEIQSVAMADSLWRVADEQIELMLDAVAIDPDVSAVAVYDESGTLVGAVGEVRDANASSFGTARDIVYSQGGQQEIIGRLVINLTDDRVRAEIVHRLLLAGLLAAALLTSVILSALVANRRTIGIPLERLLNSINLARKTGQRTLVEWHSPDEIGSVVSAFNEMQTQQELQEAELRKARNELEQRVEERTAELAHAVNEAGKARMQLSDAIESISEGFSLYDPDDRLVLCNSRYQELLYPGLKDAIQPGTPFETIIRAATDQGLVEDAKGRVDDWVEERLKRHRSPRGSHLQQRSGGRWIQINERKTDDGGTVAVYTDITELKRREQDLSEANESKDTVLSEFKAVLDTIDYGILFLDSGLRIRVHNRAYREMWDIPESFFVRRPSFQEEIEHLRSKGVYAVSEEEWDEYLAMRLELVKEGNIPPSEIHRADDSVIQYQCINLPDGGRLLTYFDLTDIKRAERAVRESEELMSTVLDHMPMPVYVRDRDGRYILVNRKYREIYGVADAEIRGRTLYDVFPKEQAEKYGAQDRQVMQQHGVAERELTVTHPDGEHIIIEVRFPIEDLSGEIISVGGIDHDISERKEAEEELRIAKEQAEQALRELTQAQQSLIQAEKMASLGHLTAGIAHEIKNPLNFVNNFADSCLELLEELGTILQIPLANIVESEREDAEDLFESLSGFLVKIKEHGQRADRIVKGMLAHAHEGVSEARPTDLNALVEESLNLAYHGMRAENPGFNVTLDRELDPKVGKLEVVPQEITRVVLNLIGNGFYATQRRQREWQQDGYEPTVKVSTRELGEEEVEIRIRDNGTGIPAEVVERIFEPFFTTKPTGEGTGLGLSLSYDAVVQQHNGRIAVDTEQGEYTEFIVTLPRARVGVI